MVTGLTVPKARERLGTIRGYGCFLTDIQRVLNQFKFKTKINKSNQISHRCIVRVELETQSHFILVWDNKIYDPARGIRDSITENIKEVLEIS